jgi:tungstate transport system substrate-binding protein
VHAPEAEAAFVAEGAGVMRYPVMHNDFLIVGPPDDPARIKGLTDAAEALRRIANSQAPFISRGDDSGTHKKERELWQAAGITPKGRWYREAGQGMGKVLQIASELDAYTLADRGTWLAFRKRAAVVALVSGDERLFNPYGIIAVNPARYPDINHQGAQALIDWITSDAGQQRIADYRLEGEVLFHPDAKRLAAH